MLQSLQLGQELRSRMKGLEQGLRSRSPKIETWGHSRMRGRQLGQLRERQRQKQSVSSRRPNRYL